MQLSLIYLFGHSLTVVSQALAFKFFIDLIGDALENGVYCLSLLALAFK